MKLKMRRLGNKGNLLAWVVALVIIFAVMLLYVTTYDVIHNKLPNVMGNLGMNTSSGTWLTLKTVFDSFPILVVIGVLLWAMVIGQKNEPGSGYY